LDHIRNCVLKLMALHARKGPTGWSQREEFGDTGINQHRSTSRGGFGCEGERQHLLALTCKSIYFMEPQADAADSEGNTSPTHRWGFLCRVASASIGTIVMQLFRPQMRCPRCEQPPHLM